MWWLALLAVGVIGWALADDDETPQPALAVATLLRDEPVTHITASWPIVWAYVPYAEDPSQGKTRPVLVLESGREGLLVLPMYSKQGRTTETEAWVQVSIESAATYDKKCTPSWIKVSGPTALPHHALAYPSREAGFLTPQDLGRLKAVMSEYAV